MTIPTYYSEGYFCSGYGVDTREKARDIALSLETHPITGVSLIEPSPATREQLVAVHDPAYVDALLTGRPNRMADRNGLGPWRKDLSTSVLLSTGGVVRAVEDALTSRGNAGSLSSGLHHAKRSTGAGFCTINGLVVAARHAVHLGARRVLIVDFDAHCGGGTASLIEGDPNITQIDLAVSRYDSYVPSPNSNLFMSDGETYLGDISRSLEAIVNPSSFDVVIYNAGMDPHERCSTGGVSGITTSVLAQRERVVFEWAQAHALPVAFVLAGGYSGRSLSRDELVDLHRLTIQSATL